MEFSRLFVLAAVAVALVLPSLSAPQEPPPRVDPLAPPPADPEPASVEPPLPPGADLSEAIELVRSGDLVRAEMKLAQEEDEFPDDPRLFLLHGEVLLALSQPARALPLLQRSAELDGEQPRVHFQLASALQATGDLEGALGSYAREIEVNDDSQVRVMAHLNRMMLLERQDDWAGAAGELEAVLELDPTQVEAYGEMARFFIQAGRLDDAASSLQRGLESGFASAEHYYSLGARFLEKEAFEPAIEAFRQAIEIDPAMADAERNLAWALDRAGQQPEAIEHFRRYLELRPDASDAARIDERIRAIE